MDGIGIGRGRWGKKHGSEKTWRRRIFGVGRKEEMLSKEEKIRKRKLGGRIEEMLGGKEVCRRGRSGVGRS